MKTEKRTTVSRRVFVRNTAAAVSTLTILRSHQIRGTQANSKINVGIVGTGGRGVYSGRNLVKTGRARIVALADYFDFKMTEAAEEFEVDASRRYAGLDGCRRIAERSDVDAVVLTSPPYFRPGDFTTAVAAGKHVFAEKPIAVDAWGCREFLKAGEEASKKGLTVVAGLQTRYDPGRRRISEHIREGAIGRPLLGSSERLGGDLWRRERPSHFSERDHQINNWLYYLWAGGDFIVEMHVHNLDVFNWFTGLLPVAATARGGRDVRTDVGDIYDHINVLYEYPNGFHLTHSGTQISSGYGGQGSRIIGSEGSYDSREGLYTRDQLRIQHGDMREASEEEMRRFTASILEEGPYLNNSDYVTTSTFTAILGREAAYRRQRLPWEELWDSNHRVEMPV